MQSAIIFGIGSPLVVDFEESAFRAGIRIVAGINNFPGPAYLTDPSLELDVAEIGASQTALPVLVPLFTPGNRRQALDEAMRLGFTGCADLIDPTSVLPRQLAHGPGLYVNAGCVLGAASTFGRSVLINRGAVIGHHVELGDFVSIGPGAVVGGNVRVGAGSLVGSGAVILPKCRIGDNAIVGAGAVVTRDVTDKAVAVGNPARVVRVKGA